jgi:cell division protein ZapA
LAQVVLSFNKRTYRFDCADDEVGRLEAIANYVKEKLEQVMLEHGAIGDERLVLMVALTLADELFDARADIDDLLDDRTGTRAAPSPVDKSHLGDRQDSGTEAEG